MSKRIPLRNRAGVTTGHVIVSDEDYPSLSRHRWYLDKRGRARRSIRIAGVPTYETVARVVAGATRRDGREVRHRNADPLDCRRENLYVVTSANPQPFAAARYEAALAAAKASSPTRVREVEP